MKATLDFCFAFVCYLVAPKWINGPGHFTTSPQLAFAGESPVFHCFARGWPTPNISWWKNSSKIRNGDINGSLMLRNRKNGVDLSVLSVSRREHAGRYTCLAENSIGSATHHIQLHVDREYPIIYYSLSSTVLWAREFYGGHFRPENLKLRRDLQNPGLKCHPSLRPIGD